ncbi:alanine racemase [Amycolatopsis azurea]|uniref:Orn/DAP/Arg decarboxylase family protein n=1 Tax=Amycolatopsis azurea DSM 43854 TaxID=1238180 RepID=M2QS21_9PSEU|nr:alanine racemase [Amycolatopsis azurea]EMD28637.1 Orn/DAP/Arg decarboxylase family protein [Amycolatopsis azurea DSM 43854]
MPRQGQGTLLAGVRPFPLTALRHPAVTTLLNEHRGLLADLLNGLGSPLHVVLPEVFEENITGLRQAFAETGADVDILFAKKANKADCFVRSAAALGVGVDAASSAELVKALGGGVPGHRIGISGPEKDDSLHALAVQHDCLVAVDSISELRRLAATARLAHRQVRVVLRSRTNSQPGSRFGMAKAERDAAVGLCVELEDHVSFLGFSFHLGGYSPEERAIAANEMIEHCLDARRRGAVSAELVDLGGGLPMRYVDPRLWDEFLQQNEPAQYHGTKAAKGFSFYPYGGHPTAQAARMIMSHPVDGDESLSAKAARHGIRFLVEPGRSLLDQAGFTVYRVQQVEDRRDTDGYAIVTVAGNSLSLSEPWFNTDYLPDPVLISGEPAADELFPACVGGATCLENDMVTWRKIGFPRPVRPGDHLVYLNTAGYHMDFIESRFHDTALPSKAVLRLGDDGAAPQWRLDGI